MDRSRFKDYTSRNRQDWVDWLSDEKPSPAAKQALRQARVNSAAAYQPRMNQPVAAANPAAPPKPDVTININLQKIKLPKPKLPKPKLSAAILSRLLPSKRVALAAVLLIALAGGAYYSFFRVPEGNIAAAGQAARSQPSFKPVAPATNPQLGGFASHVTAYDGRRDIYSYADNISGDRITVSEQPAPKNLGSVEQTVQKIASQTGADSKIATKNGEAFIRTSKETGAQTVVCSVNGLLVFINSSTKFQDTDWVRYINSLQ
ncbi:MAG TPA: hypothetical protein VFJ84_03790 [Candidatus Saccharimonadales bacterium]|nr:hypothetical protein [Candidatus Saccharimonadales bacterium]